MSFAIITLLLRVIFFITNCYTISILVINYQQLKEYRVFIWLFVAGLLQMIYASLSSIQVLLLDFENSIIYYALIEYSVIYYYFYKKLSFRHSKITLSLIYLGSLLILLVDIFNDKKIIDQYNPTLLVYESLIFLVFSIPHFFQILDSTNSLPLLKNSDFIITSGIFIFFSITCPSYFLATYFRYIDSDIAALTWILNDMAYIFFNLIITAALKCKLQIVKY